MLYQNAVILMGGGTLELSYDVFNFAFVYSVPLGFDVPFWGISGGREVPEAICFAPPRKETPGNTYRSFCSEFSQHLSSILRSLDWLLWTGKLGGVLNDGV